MSLNYVVTSCMVERFFYVMIIIIGIAQVSPSNKKPRLSHLLEKTPALTSLRRHCQTISFN